MRYFDGKDWKEITRDERYFCCELYFEIRKAPNRFIKWLNKILVLELNKTEINQQWETAIEVCFYRDYVNNIGTCNTKNISKTKYSPKRTFDLCIFSETHIIIIEAKAQQGFKRNQLESIKEEKKNLTSLIKEGAKIKECPQIIIIGIVSSEYQPKPTTKKLFSGMITWLELAEIYTKNNKIYLTANKLYTK